jgi:hypothetical protein
VRQGDEELVHRPPALLRLGAEPGGEVARERNVTTTFSDETSDDAGPQAAPTAAPLPDHAARRRHRVVTLQADPLRHPLWTRRKTATRSRTPTKARR